MPDCEERLLTIAELASQLTRACLHVTCKELGWKQRCIVVGEPPSNPFYSLRHHLFIAAIGFYRREGRRQNNRILKILNPIDAPVDYRTLPRPNFKKHGKKQRVSLSHGLIPIGAHGLKGTAHDEIFSSLHHNIMYLLMAESPNTDISPWQLLGVHPFWKDATLINFRHRKSKQFEKQEKKRAKEAKKKSKPKQSQKGRVYFIQQGDDGPIKIEYSTNPEKRLQTLNTASPYPLYLRLVIEGSKRLERELHERFAGSHMDGEWFEANTDLLDYIAAHKLDLQ